MKIIKIIIISFFTLSFIPVITLSNEVEYEEEFLSQFFWREVITLPKEKRPKVCLVLGGGGARGLSHIGVLRVLEEEGFPIDAVAGTSVGSLVGALYCSGVPVEVMENLSKEVGWSDLTNYSLRSLVSLILAGNLLSTKKMEEYITKHIGNREFYQLKIPFACVATDLKTGEKIVFSEGNVAKAVRASSTIPGVFYPVEYRHRLLVDGGLVDNIPTDLGKLLGADIIIAVDISSDFTKYATSNILLVLNQAIYIQGGMRSAEELKYADIIINPHVSEVAAYELWRAEECIEAGIIATRKMMPKLKQLLMERTFKKILESK